MVEMVIRTWRLTRGIPAGSHIWFDPSCETVRLYRTPPRDGNVVADVAAWVDREREFGYLDKVVSVSASEPGLASDDSELDEEFRVLKEDPELPF